MHAVTFDLGGLAFGGGHHAVAHHQQTVFFTRDEALDHHVGAFALRHHKGGFDVFALAQVEGDTASVVGVGGLDGDGQTDVLCHVPRLFSGVHDFTRGDGHTALGEQHFREVFVAGNAFGDGAGAVGFCGPNAALLGAVAELNQVARGQANGRDFVVRGRVHDASGAGA